MTIMTQRLVNLLKITYPLIQAPMAGGATTPELVAAVSNAGGLGSIAAGYLSAEQLTTQIQKTKALTSKPFSVNIFIPQASEVDLQKVSAMQQRLNKYRQQLGIPLQYGMPEAVVDQQQQLEQQVDIILAQQIPIVSFTFGILPDEYVKKLKAQKIVLIGTATNVTEAKMLADAGCDVIVAQGSEAGGHRGTFFGTAENSLIPLTTLIPAMVSAVEVPVIAAGGIMNARAITNNLTKGAAGVQMGTAFLTCAESGASAAYKAKLLIANGEQTKLTEVFSGKMARGIENNFMHDMEQDFSSPGYPAQHYLTMDIRNAAAAQMCSEYLSLWAGQGVGGKEQRQIPAQQLMTEIMADTQLMQQLVS